MKNIFSFTLSQQLRSKGYRSSIVVGVLLCFLLPILIMGCVEAFGTEDSPSEAEGVELAVNTIYMVDRDEDGLTDFSFLDDYALEPFDRLRFKTCTDLENAKERAAADDTSLIGVLETVPGGMKLSLVLPENTSLTEEQSWLVEEFFYDAAPVLQMEKSGLRYTQIAELSAPVSTGTHFGEEAVIDIPSDESESITLEVDGVSADLDASFVKEVLQMIFTFVNIMILYFLVLFYGQSVANSMVMEKSSKLMDTFLISVRPEEMAFGKVFALTLSSLIQLGAWILALAAGFAGGISLVRFINPDSEMMVLSVIKVIGQVSNLFDPVGILLALSILVAGLLLYNSLAAIGGAMASKTEDISTTNVMFTLALVVSFLVVLYSGGIDSLGTGGAAWQNYVPFTAVLVTPARVLLGSVGAAEGLIALGLILAGCVLLMYVAGRVYKAMALYKGEAPKPLQVLKIVFK